MRLYIYVYMYIYTYIYTETYAHTYIHIYIFITIFLIDMPHCPQTGSGLKLIITTGLCQINSTISLNRN